MWKIAVGFVIFGALALWVISKGGDSLDMGGEKHDAQTHSAAPAAAPAAAASVAAPIASVAAAAASAASK